MEFSLTYASYIIHLCMDEIRKRGLDERKIFFKSMVHNDLFVKVFTNRKYLSDDLTYMHIHTVATLMQRVLYTCDERILPKKVLNTMNYDACTISKLSAIITPESQILLIDILEFLLDLLNHKEKNAMNPFKLGDALGNAVLGSYRCNPITAGKASHFLACLIIEYSKIKLAQCHHYRIGWNKMNQASYKQHKALSKMEAAQARAKSYNRSVARVQNVKIDWLENMEDTNLFDKDDYDEFLSFPEPPESPWVSIFSSADSLLNTPSTSSQPYHSSSPLLYHILKEAVESSNHNSMSTTSTDPFASSSFFSKPGTFFTEQQLENSFNDFCITKQQNKWTSLPALDNNPHKLNHPFSQNKLKQSISQLRLTQSISQLQLRHSLSSSKLSDSILNIRSNLKGYFSKNNWEQDAEMITSTDSNTTPKDDKTMPTDTASDIKNEKFDMNIESPEPELIKTIKKVNLDTLPLVNDTKRCENIESVLVDKNNILDTIRNNKKIYKHSFPDNKSLNTENQKQNKLINKNNVKDIVKRIIKRTASRTSQSRIMGRRSSNKILCLNE
ncbi:uncharacterized protein BX663DRAFT_564047 [Cokeromyces recurvatus]|uniref:uncharacterized protein n=1 Tax=Cokeromyces recurvatus TaxID=90255 RepID=UPI00221F090F|nr:uncharacterized protein BX663DRAFT_564047 [Cokeromyces recurvatus]KAI7899223.1 hypothetical protein BX663DRAFT_564047 [Cokeromyces recurvatus]